MARPTQRRKGGLPKPTKRTGTGRPMPQLKTGGTRASSTGVARSGGRAAASGYRFGPGPLDVSNYSGGGSFPTTPIGPPTPVQRPGTRAGAGGRNVLARCTTSGKPGFKPRPIGPPTPMPSGGSSSSSGKPYTGLTAKRRSTRG
jgi:hypothetical protein